MILSEGVHPGEFIVSEGRGKISRDSATLLAGTDYVGGQVLGIIALAATAVAAAVAGNTGNGAFGAVTVGVGAKLGTYNITFIDPAANAGAFIVEDPDGVHVGNGDVAAAFTGGGISFTIADGATDFAVGDAFTVIIDAGSGKYTAHDAAAVDGSDVAAAILYAAVDATDADQPGAVIARLAEVDSTMLAWKTGISADDLAAGIAALAKNHIVSR